MKYTNIFFLLAILLITNYAWAQTTTCPNCATATCAAQDMRPADEGDLLSAYNSIPITPNITTGGQTAQACFPVNIPAGFEGYIGLDWWITSYSDGLAPEMGFSLTPTLYNAATCTAITPDALSAINGLPVYYTHTGTVVAGTAYTACISVTSSGAGDPGENINSIQPAIWGRSACMSCEEATCTPAPTIYADYTAQQASPPCSTGCNPDDVRSAPGANEKFCFTYTTPSVLTSNYISFNGCHTEVPTSCDTFLGNPAYDNTCTALTSAGTAPGGTSMYQVTPNTTYEFCFEYNGTACDEISNPCMQVFYVVPPCNNCNSPTCNNSGILADEAAANASSAGCTTTEIRDPAGATETFCTTITTPASMPSSFVSYALSTSVTPGGCATFMNRTVTSSCGVVAPEAFTTGGGRPVWQLVPSTTYELCYTYNTSACTIVDEPCIRPFYYVPPPSCSTALPLTVGTSCSPTSGTSAAGPYTPPVDVEFSCNYFGTPSYGAPAWYKFVATCTAATVTIDGAVGMDVIANAFDACTGGTELACADITGDGGIETLSLTSLTPGNTYYIQVADYFTSGGNFTICVTAAAPPTPGITNNEAPTATTVLTCSNIGISVTATGGTTYAWSGGSTPSTAANTFTSAGTYTVTVSNAGGCQATTSITITSNTTPPSATAGDNDPACGGTLNLTSSGGDTYAWTGPNGFTSALQNPTISNVNETHDGVYTVVVTGTNGCPSTATTTVATITCCPTLTAQAPAAVVSSQSTCSGCISSGGVIAAPSTACPAGSTLQYSTDGGTTWSSVLPTYNQTTAITVMTRCNCDVDNTQSSPTNSVTTVPGTCPSPTATAGDNDPACGGTLNLTSSGGASYAWTGPNGFTSAMQNPTISNVNGTHDGAYTVVVTDSGCASTATTIVATITCCPTLTAQAPAAVVSSQSTCSGCILSGGVIAAPSTACPAGSTLQYSTDGGTTWSSVLPTYNQTTAVTVMTRCNCDVDNTQSSPTNSVTTVPGTCPSPTATAGDNDPACGGTLNLTSSGGASYAWTGPNGFTSAMQNPTISNVNGTHDGAYTVVVTDSGCASTATTIVATITCCPTLTAQAPVAVVSSQSTCSGCILSGGVIAAPSTACPAGSTLQYSTDGGTTWSSVLPTYNQTTAITVMTRCNCDVDNTQSSPTNSVTTVPGTCPSPTATAGDNDPACGGTLNLTSSGGASYAWTGPNGFTSAMQNPTISNVNGTHDGAYTVVVTDSGCASTATTIVATITCTTTTLSLTLLDPCTCNNDATISIDGAPSLPVQDGTFGETVHTPSGAIPAGLVLNVEAVTGLAGVAAGDDFIYNATEDWYEIVGTHIDNVGYTISVKLYEADGVTPFDGDPGTAGIQEVTASIANKCRYPNPDFTIGNFADCATPIAITLTHSSEGNGTASFSPALGGTSPNYTLNPAGLTGAQTITLTYTGINDGNGGVAPGGPYTDATLITTPAFPGCQEVIQKSITVNCPGCAASPNMQWGN